MAGKRVREGQRGKRSKLRIWKLVGHGAISNIAAEPVVNSEAKDGLKHSVNAGIENTGSSIMPVKIGATVEAMERARRSQPGRTNVTVPETGVSEAPLRDGANSRDEKTIIRRGARRTPEGTSGRKRGSPNETARRMIDRV